MGLRRWLRGFCAITAVVAAIVIQRLRPNLPQSFICGPDNPSECRLEAAGVRLSHGKGIQGDLSAVHRAAVARFEDAKRLGRPPNLLYIGPHYTVHELEAGGMFDFRKLLAPWFPRMVFVDPNPRVIPLLRQKMVSFGADPKDTTVLNAAVCDKDGHQHFYMAAERLFEERHMDEAARSELEFGMSMVPGYTEGAGVPAEYVEKVLVTCFTPSSLLDAAQIADSAVDVLVVDAEGYDLGILERWLKVDGFRPAVASFEWSGVYKIISHTSPNNVEVAFNSQVAPLLTSLAKAGYMLYQDDGDIWAVHQKP